MRASVCAYSATVFLAVAILVFSAFAYPAEAKDEQSDSQCPAGGVVGQSCVDSTNGYTTSGTCTHINVCAAKSKPTPPKGCQPGQVAGKDCPYGPNAFGTPTGPVRSATSTYIPDSAIGGSDIFDAAYSNGSESSDTFAADSLGQSTIVASTSIAGIQFLITGNYEAIQVGSPLTPAPEPVAIASDIGATPSYLGSTLAGANPSSDQGALDPREVRGYAADSSFGKVPSASDSGNDDTLLGAIIGIFSMIGTLLTDLLTWLIMLILHLFQKT